MRLPLRRHAMSLALPLMWLGAWWGGAGVRPVADTVQEPREVACVRASAPVRVDGVADEAAWDHAVWTEPFVDIRGDDGPAPGLATRARLLWDDQYLYVHADMAAPHLWATLRERDDTIWHDDDFEVFLDPDGDGLDYYEVEVNALGTVLDLFLDRPYAQRGKANLGWNLPGLQVGVHLRGTLNDPSDLDEGWSVEMAIPWTDLRAPGADAFGRPPEAGDVWRVNFSRVVWPMEIRDGAYAKAIEGAAPGSHPENNWVWSPQGVIDMHRPERWGRVRFIESREGGA